MLACQHRPSGAIGVEDLNPPRDSYPWRLPQGFPPPPFPPGNPVTPEKVELGRRLFYDTRLSGNQSYSCANCHRPELAFSDGLAQAVGATGQVHPRSAMSLANVGYNATLTWADPKVRRLERQAGIPMFNQHPVELGLAGRMDEALLRLSSDPKYVELFGAAYPHRAGEEPVDELILRTRPSKEITLKFVATPLAQEERLARCLDPLGDDFQPEPMGHCDDRRGQRRIVRIHGQVGDEAAIDLHSIDREAAQIGQ